MATVGPKLTIPFIVGTSQIVGQGTEMDAWLLYSTDPPDTVDPEWTDATGYLHSYGTSRGRDSELADVDAGTATIVLDDRDRTFDPDFNSLIAPMNQWQIFERFSGETHSVFKGYAEAYQEEWVNGSQAAWTTVSCADEYKNLALDQLPMTDPPHATYQDLVMFDAPTGYWPMLNDGGRVNAVVGEPLVAGNFGSYGVVNAGAIVGQADPSYIYTTSTDYMQTPEITYAQSGDVSGLSEFAIEAWIAVDGTPASSELLLSGPKTIALAFSWKLSLNTSRQLVLVAKNSGGTDHTVTSTTALTSATFPSNNVWYHVVGTIDGGNLSLYVNGVSEASTAWAGSFGGLDNGFTFVVGNAGTDISTNARAFDEIAFYRFGLSAARVVAHYNAGRLRGFARQQEPGDRITSVLDAADNIAPRAIRTGTNNMTGTYMTGQDPLSEIRSAETAESVDAVLFIARDGTVTFLDAAHRAASPWNTIQATFDDDGTDLPYQDIELDYSDAFLANKWNVTREGGTLVTVSSGDGKRVQSLTGLPIINDADVASIAAAMLAKYENPMRRVKQLTLTPVDIDVLDNVFRREIGDRIRVLRTPPGGGARIDQTLFIQKIAVDGVPGQPRRVVLGVSPL